MANHSWNRDRLFILALSVTRSFMGLLWLGTLRWKLPPTFTAPAGERGLLDWLQLEVSYPVFDVYADMIANVVIPNFTVFAWLVFISELAVGMALLTGTLTRPFAWVGLVMSINLGIGLLAVPGEWPWSYAMMILIHGLLGFSPGSQMLGLDRWLHRRAGNSLLAWMWA